MPFTPFHMGAALLLDAVSLRALHLGLVGAGALGLLGLALLESDAPDGATQ